MLWDSILIKRLKQANLWRQRVDWWLPETGLAGYEVLFSWGGRLEGKENVLRWIVIMVMP